MGITVPKANGNYIEFVTPALSNMDQELITIFVWLRSGGRSQSSTAELAAIDISGATGFRLSAHRAGGTNYGLRFNAGFTTTIGLWINTGNIGTSGANWDSWSITYDSGDTSNVPLARFNGVNHVLSTNIPPAGGRRTGHNQVKLGGPGGSDTWFGDLALFTVWKAILTPTELDCMHAGVHPQDIRPSDIVFHAPLKDVDPEPEWSGQGTGGDHVGTVTATTDEPPVARPRFMMGNPAIIAAGPAPMRRIFLTA